MPTLFSKIIAGEIPGRFVWSDDRCVAFLTIEPLTPGHVLVVPREEVPVWTDVEPALMGHLTAVAQTIGRAQRASEAQFRRLLHARLHAADRSDVARQADFAENHAVLGQGDVQGR